MLVGAMRHSSHSALSAPAQWPDWTNVAGDCGMLSPTIRSSSLGRKEAALMKKILARVAPIPFVAVAEMRMVHTGEVRMIVQRA